MVILNLGQLEDNHFFLYIFINATINVSNAMMNLTSLNERIIMVAVTINAYATIV